MEGEREGWRERGREGEEEKEKFINIQHNYRVDK